MITAYKNQNCNAYNAMNKYCLIFYIRCHKYKL